MRPLTQTQWHKLAGRIERIIYLDNGLNPFGTPLATASCRWLRKKHPAVSTTMNALADTLAYELSSSTKPIHAEQAIEAWHVLRRWRNEVVSQELPIPD